MKIGKYLDHKVEQYGDKPYLFYYDRSLTYREFGKQVDRLAACSQPSAFSPQLPNKHREHTFDFGGLLFQLIIVIGLNNIQVSGQ